MAQGFNPQDEQQRSEQQRSEQQRNEQQRKRGSERGAETAGRGMETASSRGGESGTRTQDARSEASMERRRDAGIGAFGTSQLGPFVMMRRMIEDMDRLFDNLGFGVPLLSSQGGSGLFGLRWAPELDVLERDGNLVIRADLPGMTQEDIQIEVERDNTLVLRGERKHEQESESGGRWLNERSYGTFRRTIRLPDGIDVDNAVARFDNGVLEITMQLPRSMQTRRIEIKGGEGSSGARKDTSSVQH